MLAHVVYDSNDLVMKPIFSEAISRADVMAVEAFLRDHCRVTSIDVQSTESAESYKVLHLLTKSIRMECRLPKAKTISDSILAIGGNNQNRAGL